MNLYQAESVLAEASRGRAVTDRPVESIGKAKTGEFKTPKAKKKMAFLGAFEKSLSVTLSARFAEIDRTTHYEWLAQDAQYKAAFEMKILMARDAARDELVSLGRTGVFVPIVYKGRFCYEKRIRIICQLADGTSAFQDELPKGAKVTSSRMVTVRDGKMIGKFKRSPRALLMALSIMMPEKYGHCLQRERKPRAD